MSGYSGTSTMICPVALKIERRSLSSALRRIIREAARGRHHLLAEPIDAYHEAADQRHEKIQVKCSLITTDFEFLRAQSRIRGISINSLTRRLVRNWEFMQKNIT